MIVLIDGVRYQLVTPESEAWLEKAIQSNSSHIFGPDSFYFDIKKLIRSKAGVASIPDGYVIFFTRRPQWAIVEVELASHPIHNHVIPQLNKFNIGIEDSSTRKKLVEILYGVFDEDEVLKARLKQKIKTGEVYKFISDLVSEKPLVVVAIDQRTEELNEALKFIGGEVKVVEFKTFRREDVSDDVNAYMFEPVFSEPHVPRGLKLRSVYKGIEFTAELVEDGKIRFRDQTYNSPTAAAIAAIQSTGSKRKNEDGLRWWKYVDPKTGEEKPLVTKPIIGPEPEPRRSEFWEPIRREGLFKGKPVPIRDEAWIGKGVRGIFVELILQDHKCLVQVSCNGEDRLERRRNIIRLFPKNEYEYKVHESPKYARVRFPVLDKGKKDREHWPEMREKLTKLGTDIYNKIKESGI